MRPVVIGNHPQVRIHRIHEGWHRDRGQPDFVSRLLKHQGFVQTHFNMRRGVVENSKRLSVLGTAT